MKKHFTKKRVIWGIIILLVLFLIGRGIFGKKSASGNIQTGTAKKQNLKLTVLTTGQVVSGTDLDLSFTGSGVVRQVKVNAGDNVKTGQVLATLDQSSAVAGLTTAQGSLAQAKANYEKVLAGSSDQQIAVSQAAVNAAQVTLQNASTTLATTIAQQNTAVRNAYNTLLNTAFSAIPGSSNTDGIITTITGTYNASAQGVYQITVYATGNGLKFQTGGLESVSGNAQTQPSPMGGNGLYIQFSGTPSPSDTWSVSIPNTYAPSYTTNYNAYQTALQAQSAAVTSAQNTVNSAQSALQQAQANLNQAMAAARPADVDAAQGQVLAAQATYNNTLIIAPADGTITQVDIKVGELATAQKEVLILQNVSNLHAEANVSEANIASLQPGQSVDYTFDALGPDRHFNGAVLTVNPASTVISGVVDYLVKAGLPNIPEIKPGMTANMTILVAQKDNVLSVPQQAIVSQNGSQYVRVIDDQKKLTYHQVQVQTGLSADGGLVEITSGLNEGQQVVTFIKQ
jgi:HlyD family secretion protein